MGRACAALNFQRTEEVLSYFALEEKDVSLEYADEGVFEGDEAVKAAFNDLIMKPDQKGYMLDMQLTTPMIEVADDVKTAKALWWCPGISSLPQEGEDPKALWCWGMVGADLIFRNEWKIWHLHYFRFIRCDYAKGWVKDTNIKSFDEIPEKFKTHRTLAKVGGLGFSIAFLGVLLPMYNRYVTNKKEEKRKAQIIKPQTNGQTQNSNLQNSLYLQSAKYINNPAFSKVASQLIQEK